MFTVAIVLCLLTAHSYGTTTPCPAATAKACADEGGTVCTTLFPAPAGG